MTSIIKWKSHINNKNTGTTENPENTENPDPQSDLITLLSYNILADAHMQSNLWLYKECEPQSLIHANRFGLILNAILEANPDILFLQEVQANSMKNYFYFYHNVDEIRKFLSTELNHNCFYSQRPNADGFPGKSPDGCMLSYNQDRFMAFQINPDSETCTFSSKLDYSKNCPLPGTSDNTGLVIVLQDLENMDKFIIAGNTHLVYSPNRGHIKLWQVTRLVQEILRLKNYLMVDHGIEEKNVSIVFGGDMNSTLSSPVCKFLTESVAVDMERISLKEFSGQKRDKAKTPKVIMDSVKQISGNSGGGMIVMPFQSESQPNIIESEFKFDRVYGVAENSRNYTTFGRKFVDHLFCDNVVVAKELKVPVLKEDRTIDVMPSDVHGSDHVPIGMQFRYK